MAQDNTDSGIMLLKPARLLEGALIKPIAFQQGADPNYFGHFGIDDDQDAHRAINYFAQLIHKHTGSFTRPEDYQMPIKSGRQQANETMQYCEFTYRNTPEYASRLEKAEKKAELFVNHRWVLKARSKFSVSLAASENGAIVDYTGSNEAIMQQLEREMFYQGAYMVPNFKGRAYSPKKVGDKYGVTAMLQHVLFVSHGEKLYSAGKAASEVFKGWDGYSAVDPTAGANYGQPQQNYGQPMQSQPPQQNYGQPMQSQPPQQNYGQPMQSQPPQYATTGYIQPAPDAHNPQSQAPIGQGAYQPPTQPQGNYARPVQGQMPSGVYNPHDDIPF